MRRRILFNLFIGILITNMNQKRDQEFTDNLKLMRERILAKLGDLSDGDLGMRVEEIFMSIDKVGKRRRGKIAQRLQNAYSHDSPDTVLHTHTHTLSLSLSQTHTHKHKHTHT